MVTVQPTYFYQCFTRIALNVFCIMRCLLKKPWLYTLSSAVGGFGPLARDLVKQPERRHWVELQLCTWESIYFTAGFEINFQGTDTLLWTAFPRTQLHLLQSHINFWSTEYSHCTYVLYSYFIFCITEDLFCCRSGTCRQASVWRPC